MCKKHIRRKPQRQLIKKVIEKHHQAHQNQQEKERRESMEEKIKKILDEYENTWVVYKISTASLENRLRKHLL